MKAFFGQFDHFFDDNKFFFISLLSYQLIAIITANNTRNMIGLIEPILKHFEFTFSCTRIADTFFALMKFFC